MKKIDLREEVEYYSTEEIIQKKHFDDIKPSQLSDILDDVVKSLAFLYDHIDFKSENTENVESINDALEYEKQASALDQVCYGILCILNNVPSEYFGTIETKHGQVSIIDVLSFLVMQYQIGDENIRQWHEYCRDLLDYEMQDFYYELYDKDAGGDDDE